jgi:RNA polymerase sigma-70 factor, ECF subfamily
MSEAPEDWLPELMKEYGRLVFTTAYRITGCAEDAEDVLQEVFLKIADASDNSATRSNSIREWGAYLRTMAARKAIDCLRQRRKNRREMTAFAETLQPFPATDSDREASRHQQASLLRRALERLDPRDATVFSLRYLEDLNYQEIAAQMNVSVSQVGVILHRARNRLREFVKDIAVNQGE